MMEYCNACYSPSLCKTSGRCLAWPTDNDDPYIQTFSSIDKTVNDPINPDHYKYGEWEAIDLLRILLTPEEFKGGLKFSLWQYLLRYEKKGGAEDLRKAHWYIDRLIKEWEER